MKVVVVMGGYSSEREVSLRTGRGVMGALARLGHDPISLDFDASFIERVRAVEPDAVFNALHGVGGEDGTIQAMLDWMRLPYTGSGVLASALSMDKHLTKKLLRAEGLPTANWEMLELGKEPASLPASIALPFVVKPRADGSSRGVSIVRADAQWPDAIARLAHDGTSAREFLVEEFIRGAEFSCGVLFDQALPVIEIVPQDAFYSYDAKYAQGGSRHFVPARIDDALARLLQDLALRVHRAVGLRDYSRTDFIVDERGEPFILETNALPGLTPTSLVPEECAAAGISYDALVERLLEAAFARGDRARV